MLLKISLVIGCLIAVVLIIAALPPAEFVIERTVRIAAPASTLFAQINNFHQWPAWSPYEKLDPAMKRTFSGPDAGPGATYEWSGNSQAGAGKISVVESQPNGHVGMKLEMIKPFASTNGVDFTLQPEGNQTAVTWKMAGRNPFIAKVAGLFMNMDRMVGGQFEDGLNRLKANAENGPRD